MCHDWFTVGSSELPRQLCNRTNIGPEKKRKYKWIDKTWKWEAQPYCLSFCSIHLLFRETNRWTTRKILQSLPGNWQHDDIKKEVK